MKKLIKTMKYGGKKLKKFFHKIQTPFKSLL